MLSLPEKVTWMRAFFVDTTAIGERTALFTRFRRACPGSERTSGGYIERPITPPLALTLAPDTELNGYWYPPSGRVE